MQHSQTFSPMLPPSVYKRGFGRTCLSNSAFCRITLVLVFTTCGSAKSTASIGGVWYGGDTCYVGGGLAVLVLVLVLTVAVRCALAGLKMSHKYRSDAFLKLKMHQNSSSAQTTPGEHTKFPQLPNRPFLPHTFWRLDLGAFATSTPGGGTVLPVLSLYIQRCSCTADILTANALHYTSYLYVRTGS